MGDNRTQTHNFPHGKMIKCQRLAKVVGGVLQYNKNGLSK